MSDFVTAAYHGDLNEVKRLLSINGNINVKDHEKDTAILKACRNCNNSNIVAFLLENGANINDEPFRDSIGQTPLIIASQAGCTNIVELLLRAGAEIEHRNDQGETAFITAIQEGNIDIVKLLINKVNNIDQPNADGETPLELARKYKQKEIINLLLKNGASETASGIKKGKKEGMKKLKSRTNKSKKHNKVRKLNQTRRKSKTTRNKTKRSN
jgi:ankyrin repeat protein